MPKQTFFSGVQPSGNLHIGNYLGAIKNWADIQEEYNAICCVVNLHAITMPQDPEELNRKTIEVAKLYIAAGLDPEKVTIFRQSDVPQHTELMWLLNTITKTGELFKMTQFKDKSGIQSNGATEKISVGAGVLNYPILMAADILMYNADVVPVGEDQTQHIEITRTLARRFNKKFAETFTVPNIYTSKAGKKIMALDNPLKKMSKSAEATNSRIELLDEPDVIRKKIMKATTDSENKIYYSDAPEKAGLKNLLNIFSIITDTTPEQIAENYKEKGYGDFKKDLAEVMVEYLKPIQDKFNSISDEEVLEIFAKSKESLTTQATTNLTKIKKAMGLE
jgi:tryptophanyl-tRNA synthetase